MESTAPFWLPWNLYRPYQQQQQQTGRLYFPAPPMLVAPPFYSLPYPPLSMDQSVTNLGLQLRSSSMDQSNQTRTALAQHHMPLLLPSHESTTSFLLAELATTRERIMELEACLMRVEAEREMWQGMAREHEAKVASLKQTVEQLCEPSIGSSPDVDDAASCTGHPMAAEEQREG